MGRTNAVIYVDGQGEDQERAIRQCLRHCDQLGYAVHSLVIDDSEEHCRWRAALQVLASGAADVLVYGGSELHRITPRLEIAGDQPRKAVNAAPLAAQRRPRPAS